MIAMLDGWVDTLYVYYLLLFYYTVGIIYTLQNGPFRQSTLTVPKEFTIWVFGRVLASEKSKTDSGRAAGAKNAIKTLKSALHRSQNSILDFHPPRFWSPQNVLLLAVLFVRYAGLPILNFDFVPHNGNRVHTQLTKFQKLELLLLLDKMSV